MLRIYNTSGSAVTVEGVRIAAGEYADMSTMVTTNMRRLECNRRISIFEIPDPVQLIETQSEPADEPVTQSRKSKRTKPDEESGGTAE